MSGCGAGKSFLQCCDQHHRRGMMSLKLNWHLPPHHLSLHSIPTHSLNTSPYLNAHSLVTITSLMTLRKKNHLLHASVDERASSTRTFAHTSDKWKLNVATEFSEFVMNAYYQPNKNTKADVMDLIDKFNRNNTGNIFLKFNPDARTMDKKLII